MKEPATFPDMEKDEIEISESTRQAGKEWYRSLETQYSVVDVGCPI